MLQQSGSFFENALNKVVDFVPKSLRLPVCLALAALALSSIPTAQANTVQPQGDPADLFRSRVLILNKNVAQSMQLPADVAMSAILSTYSVPSVNGQEIMVANTESPDSAQQLIEQINSDPDSTLTAISDFIPISAIETQQLPSTSDSTPTLEDIISQNLSANDMLDVPRFGLDGDGEVVAFLDSPIHHSLRSKLDVIDAQSFVTGPDGNILPYEEFPTYFHGSATASTFKSIAPKVKVISAVVCYDTGCSALAANDALNYIFSHYPQLHNLNMSFGGFYPSGSGMCDTIAKAPAILRLFASAGNDNQPFIGYIYNRKPINFEPAACPSSQLIPVGSYDWRGNYYKPTSWTNYNSPELAGSTNGIRISTNGWAYVLAPKSPFGEPEIQIVGGTSISSPIAMAFAVLSDQYRTTKGMPFQNSLQLVNAMTTTGWCPGPETNEKNIGCRPIPQSLLGIRRMYLPNVSKVDAR